MIVPACNSFSWTKETRDRTHVCRVTIPGWIPFHHPKYLFVLWRICTCYRLDRATQSRNLQGCAHAGLVWSSPHVLSGTSTCTQPGTHPPSPPPPRTVTLAHFNLTFGSGQTVWPKFWILSPALWPTSATGSKFFLLSGKFLFSIVRLQNDSQTLWLEQTKKCSQSFFMGSCHSPTCDCLHHTRFPAR